MSDVMTGAAQRQQQLDAPSDVVVDKPVVVTPDVNTPSDVPSDVPITDDAPTSNAPADDGTRPTPGTFRSRG